MANTAGARTRARQCTARFSGAVRPPTQEFASTHESTQWAANDEDSLFADFASPRSVRSR